MTAGALELLRELTGEACAGCDGPMVVTLDALQRPRKRCPKCDGVSRKRVPHPDTVLVPVQLVKLSAVASALPPIETGQLRCQYCARGVDGNVRFCAACVEARSRPLCKRCHNPFARARKWQLVCDACEAAAAAPTVTLCTGCNRLSPRTKHGKLQVQSCPHCRPRHAPSAAQTCLACGATSPRAKGAKFTVKTCSACPPKPRRQAKPRPAPRTHPRDLPSDDPRKILWIAQREATRRAHGSAAYKPKVCAYPDCGTTFQPTGPRSIHCEEHRR